MLGTGHHAAVAAGVTQGQRVAVVGGGAVGLLAVLSAKRLGAEQIILRGHHGARSRHALLAAGESVVAVAERP